MEYPGQKSLGEWILTELKENRQINCFQDTFFLRFIHSNLQGQLILQYKMTCMVFIIVAVQTHAQNLIRTKDC